MASSSTVGTAGIGSVVEEASKFSRVDTGVIGDTVLAENGLAGCSAKGVRTWSHQPECVMLTVAVVERT